MRRYIFLSKSNLSSEDHSNLQIVQLTLIARLNLLNDSPLGENLGFCFSFVIRYNRESLRVLTSFGNLAENFRLNLVLGVKLFTSTSWKLIIYFTPLGCY